MARRNLNSTDSRRYYEWLDHAESDLRSARILHGVGADPNTVAYHCHQVAEKSLKSFVLLRQNRHLDGHNITFLTRQAARLDRDFEPFVERSPSFNRYYIETRYPTDLPFVIDESELREALRFAQDVYVTVARKIAHELKEDIEEEEK